MTTFVLAWARPGTQLAPTTGAELAAALAPAGTVSSFSSARVAVAVWDSALWDGPSVLGDAAAGAVVAGDPVLWQQDAPTERPQAAQALAARLLDEGGALLRHAEGTHACAAWGGDGRALVGTDKLGVRPVYWARVGDRVYAATAKWVLERLADIPRDEDLHGIVEATVFGAPLGDRTTRAAIQCLGAGHCLDLRGDAPRAVPYWDWAQLPAAPAVPPAQLPAHILDAFREAVASRLQGRERVFAFLSGGMDSRLIVALLRERGVPVSSMNFAPPGSQDLIYGRMAAEAAGTDHFEFDEGGIDFAARRNSALHNWDADPARAALRPRRAGLVWSGDGGSVGLGHVYLDEAMVAAARSGGPAPAARAIQAANGYTLSPVAFNAAHRGLAQLPFERIVDDLASRPHVEPGRNVHLFFMLNDQRRHLAAHFETLHEHRIDLVLPFFDGRFLAAVLAQPVDPFLLHRLYNDIMALLPFGLGRVPWQCYPGHAPCPVPVTVEARHQWTGGWYSRSDVRRDTRQQMQRRLRYALSQRFPSDVMSRPALAMAALFGLSGSARFGHLWNVALMLEKMRG